MNESERTWSRYDSGDHVAEVAEDLVRSVGEVVRDADLYPSAVDLPAVSELLAYDEVADRFPEVRSAGREDTVRDCDHRVPSL